MTRDKPPLRTPFRVLGLGTKGKYSVYRQILRGLGLASEEALDSFFLQIRQSGNKFPVEAVMDVERPNEGEPEFSCSELPYSNFLYGGQDIAVFDDPQGVMVAHRVGGVIEVYSVGEFFLNLLDSFRVTVAATYTPRFGYHQGHKSAACINCLNALLGLGYRVTTDGADGTTLIIQTPVPSKRIAFDVQHLSILVEQMLNGSLKSDLANPEWVFDMLNKWHSEQKEVANTPVVQA